MAIINPNISNKNIGIKIKENIFTLILFYIYYLVILSSLIKLNIKLIPNILFSISLSKVYYN